MRKQARTMLLGAYLTPLIFCVTLAMAQQSEAPRRGGDRPDFAEIQARMMERMKENLGATDEEWKVVGPLVQSVMEKQREMGRGGFRGMMGFGGRGMRGPGRGGDQPPEARGDQPPRREGDQGPRRGGFGGPEMDDPEGDALQAALDAKDTPAEEIQTKLKALRDARKARADALAKAREELRKVLTARQEATLVLMGFLD